MKNLFVLLICLSFAVSTGLASAADSSPPAVIGTWNGSSVCTDLQFAPACKNEVVIYEFQPLSGKDASHVHLMAYRVVGGEKGLMYEIELAYDLKLDRWLGEFRNARNHILWTYAVLGDRIEGTLTDVATGTLLRRVAVRRV